MNTKATNKLLNDIINRVTGMIMDTNLCRISLAREMWSAHNVINWRLTKYKGWHNFVTQEFTISVSNSYSYMYVGKMAEAFKYSDKDLARIVEVIGWTKLQRGLIRQNRRISVKGFIAKYKNLSTSTHVPPTGSCEDRVYMFSLPKEIAEVLDFYLEEHGMRQTNGRRFNVRNAFISLIKDKLAHTYI
jgi:hypothetical protein